MTLNELRDVVHQNAVEHGFYETASANKLEEIPEKLCLIHSEVSEALEVYREVGFMPQEAFAAPRYTESADRKKPTGFDSEMADIIIRTLDLAGFLGIDIERAVMEKHKFNASRAFKHGKVC